jgi:hypothetical protein
MASQFSLQTYIHNQRPGAEHPGGKNGTLKVWNVKIALCCESAIFSCIIIPKAKLID